MPLNSLRETPMFKKNINYCNYMEIPAVIALGYLYNTMKNKYQETTTQLPDKYYRMDINKARNEEQKAANKVWSDSYFAEKTNIINPVRTDFGSSFRTDFGPFGSAIGNSEGINGVESGGNSSTFTTTNFQKMLQEKRQKYTYEHSDAMNGVSLEDTMAEPFSFENSPVVEGFSQLTGLPMEMTHSNMQPSFGSQPNLPRGDYKFIWNPKTEVESYNQNFKENIFGMQNLPAEYRENRYLPSKLKNGILPVPQQMVPPISVKEHAPRAFPRTVDELRAVNNPKVSYETILSKAAGPQKGPSGINLDKPKHQKLPENLMDFSMLPTIATYTKPPQRQDYSEAKQTLRGDLMSDLVPIASYTVGEVASRFSYDPVNPQDGILEQPKKEQYSTYGHTAPFHTVGNAGDYQQAAFKEYFDNVTTNRDTTYNTQSNRNLKGQNKPMVYNTEPGRTTNKESTIHNRAPGRGNQKDTADPSTFNYSGKIRTHEFMNPRNFDRIDKITNTIPTKGAMNIQPKYNQLPELDRNNPDILSPLKTNPFVINPPI